MEKIHKKYSDYAISDAGKITSIKFGRRILLKTCLSTSGYPQVSIYQEGNKYIRVVHKLVAETFIENPENKPQVNHIDGNKKNNHVDNLEWATAKENQNHAIQNGLFAFSTKEKLIDMNRLSCEKSALFTIDEASDILEFMHYEKVSQTKMASLVGCSIPPIAKLVHGTTRYFRQEAT